MVLYCLVLEFVILKGDHVSISVCIILKGGHVSISVCIILKGSHVSISVYHTKRGPC